MNLISGFIIGVLVTAYMPELGEFAVNQIDNLFTVVMERHQ